MSSDEDWGILPKNNSDSGNQEIAYKPIHRIASTSTIKSIYTESPPSSPAASTSFKKPELQVIAQARLKLLSKPINFNILILGDSNIGKTSFIHSVLAKNFNVIVPELIGTKALNPTRNIFDNIGIISSDGTELRVNLIDTPGYGFFTSKQK